MFSRAARQQDQEVSRIGPDAVLTGDIVTAGSLHIEGVVKGDVRCGRLSQGAAGAVHGNIVAEHARLAGLVDGAVEAGALVLEASARVTGDILYQSVGIAPGAQVEGRLRRSKGPADHGAAAARAEAADARGETRGSAVPSPAGAEASAPPAVPGVEASAPAPAVSRSGKRGGRASLRDLELFSPSVEAAE